MGTKLNELSSFLSFLATMIASSRQRPSILTVIAVLNSILLSAASSNIYLMGASLEPHTQQLYLMSLMNTCLSIHPYNPTRCILRRNFTFSRSVAKINQICASNKYGNHQAPCHRSISLAMIAANAFQQNASTKKYSTNTFNKTFYPKFLPSLKSNHVLNARIGQNQNTFHKLRGAYAPLFMSTSQNSHAPNNLGTNGESTTLDFNNAPIKILDRGPYHLVVAKPPSVVCHHSEWAGLRKKNKKYKRQNTENYIHSETNHDDVEEEQPMLQRVRDAMHGRRVNLIHRLDRGASGCLIFSFADGDRVDESDFESESTDEEKREIPREKDPNPTSQLIQSLQNPNSIKTYVALVRGEGILHGEDLKAKGWFSIDRPIKDEKGRVRDAITEFRFLAGYTAAVLDDLGSKDEGENGLNNTTTLLFENKSANEPQPVRASVVLARPKTGRWHQIRRHLNGLSHPILGDSTHGNSKINREWREYRNMLGERTCLHLGRVQLVPTTVALSGEDAEVTTNVLPNGLDVTCPIPRDMFDMIAVYMPQLLEEVVPLLAEEGITFESEA